MPNMVEVTDEFTGENAQLDTTPTKTILKSLNAYGPFILAGWIGFEIARRRLERAYYVRENKPETATPATVMARNAGVLAWIWPLYTTSDDVILQSCGLDTLFFLRFLRLCQKVAWLSILLSTALFPIYFYAQRGNNFDALYKMTLSHLDADNDAQRWRFWFTVLAMYLVSGFTCFLLHREFNVYVRRRHEFLSRQATQQYSVVVNGLPAHLRTQQTLRNYMDTLFPKQVVDVYVALECGDLEKLVAERVKVRNRLENALARSAKDGERMLTKKNGALCGGEKVDAIDLYQTQLKSLNDAVEMEVRSIMRNQAALANQMVDNHYEEGVDSDVPTLQVTSQEDIQVIDEYRATESDYIKGLRKMTLTLGRTSDNIMRSTGFVTFNTLRAANAAQQVLQCSDPTLMHVEAAAHVDDVVWKNVGISLNTKQYWGLISTAATSAIVIFWTIPTAFIVTLSKVDKLKESWPALGEFADKNTWMAPLLQQISPLMLSIMGALAPIIFGILSEREGHASAAAVDKSLLNKLVIYQWYVVLLLPILGGTFLDSLLGKGEKFDVNEVIRTISEQLPLQSSYYITFLMVQMGLPTSLELLRVKPIIKAAIYHFLAPKLTPRQRSTPWFGLSPLSVPGDFGATDPISQFFLVFILIVVFSSIAPILCYFAAAYLFLSEILYRWTVLCVADPSPNTGAVYWPSLYRFCIGALLFAQIVMATVMGLKKAAAAATASIVLPFLTGLFHLFVWSRFPRTAQYLPLDECVSVDQRRQRHLDDLVKSLDEHYRQPAMAERDPIQPDYAELASNPNDEEIGRMKEESRTGPDQPPPSASS